MDGCFAKIRSGKLKLTPRRRAIVELFLKEKKYLTPDTVWQALRKRFSRCGLPGVYRNLESLAECGVLTKIQSDGRKRCYGVCAGRGGRHHHHIVCVKCGKVDTVEGCGFETKRTIKGFKVIDHFVQVNGICARCG